MSIWFDHFLPQELFRTLISFSSSVASHKLNGTKALDITLNKSNKYVWKKLYTGYMKKVDNVKKTINEEN